MGPALDGSSQRRCSVVGPVTPGTSSQTILQTAASKCTKWMQRIVRLAKWKHTKKGIALEASLLLFRLPFTRFFLDFLHGSLLTSLLVFQLRFAGFWSHNGSLYPPEYCFRCTSFLPVAQLVTKRFNHAENESLEIQVRGLWTQQTVAAALRLYNVWQR